MIDYNSVTYHTSTDTSPSGVSHGELRQKTTDVGRVVSNSNVMSGFPGYLSSQSSNSIDQQKGASTSSVSHNSLTNITFDLPHPHIHTSANNVFNLCMQMHFSSFELCYQELVKRGEKSIL